MRTKEVISALSDASSFAHACSASDEWCSDRGRRLCQTVGTGGDACADCILHVVRELAAHCENGSEVLNGGGRTWSGVCVEHADLEMPRSR
jgi:hypothetical protein